jgi:AcrR family transcriptional regulator
MAPGPVRRRVTRRSPQERRAAFLDAAVVAIRRDGPKVSMEAIARQAGVTKPIVYRLFGDRDGLLRALGEKLASDVLTEVTTAMEGAGDDPKEMLRTAIAAYVALIDDETEVYRFVTEQTPAGADVTGLSAEVARAIAVVLGEQLRERGADSGAAEPWAFGIVGMVHLAGDWWVRTRTLPRDRLVTYLVDLLWDGFVALDPQAGRGDP